MPQLLAGRTPRTLNMSTIGDDLLRPASPGFGPQVEALIVYKQQPGGGGAPNRPRWWPASRAKTCSPWCWSTSRPTTADYADYLLPATTQLEHWGRAPELRPHRRGAEPPGPSPPLGEAKPNTQIFRELARHMGYTGAAFEEGDESLCRRAFGDKIPFDTLLAQGFATLPTPEAPFADGGFPTAVGQVRVLQRTVGGHGPGRPARLPAQLRAGRRRCRLPAGDDLATGAQLFETPPSSTCKACATSKANRCWRCMPTTRKRAASSRAAW